MDGGIAQFREICAHKVMTDKEEVRVVGGEEEETRDRGHGGETMNKKRQQMDAGEVGYRLTGEKTS